MSLAVTSIILNKEVNEANNSMLSNYQGGKFFRGRKYSFPFHQNEIRKVSEGAKVGTSSQLKKLNGKNSMNLMMLNVNGDALGQGYDEITGYSNAHNRMKISNPSTGNSRQNIIKHPSQSKKKKSSSAQSSPNRNGLKTSKNQNINNGIGVGLSNSVINETRPYSAKNTGYSRVKGYSTKSKKGEMKRSSSKKSPNSNSKDFNPMLYNKYGNPSGIGLYGPGKIKISKDKQNVSSRGSTRWNKSPGAPAGTRSSKGKIVSAFPDYYYSSTWNNYNCGIG